MNNSSHIYCQTCGDLICPFFLKGEPGFIGPQGEPGLPGLPGTKVSGVFSPSFLSEKFLWHIFSPFCYSGDQIVLPNRELNQLSTHSQHFS